MDYVEGDLESDWYAARIIECGRDRYIGAG